MTTMNANNANMSKMRATMIGDGCQFSAKIVFFPEKAMIFAKKLAVEGPKMFKIRDFM